MTKVTKTFIDGWKGLNYPKTAEYAFVWDAGFDYGLKEVGLDPEVVESGMKTDLKRGDRIQVPYGTLMRCLNGMVFTATKDFTCEVTGYQRPMNAYIVTKKHKDGHVSKHVFPPVPVYIYFNLRRMTAAVPVYDIKRA